LISYRHDPAQYQLIGYKLDGIQRISEQKLNELPADKLKVLQENGSLQRMHAHLVSLKNFDRLYKLKAKAQVA